LHDVRGEMSREFPALIKIILGFDDRALHQPGHSPISVTQGIAGIELERAVVVGDSSIEVAFGAAGIGPVVPAFNKTGLQFDGPAVRRGLPAR
jgi:hypothetical protein